jgi:Domain of unknown function (DUF4259)
VLNSIPEPDFPMLRTWATGSAHDDKPLDWLFDLRYGKGIDHISAALQGAIDDRSVGACQTALLAAECVACLRGAPADLHDDARRWVETTPMTADQDLLDLALRVVQQIHDGSQLRTWWEQRGSPAEWLEAVAYLTSRIQGGQGPDRGQPDMETLAGDFEAARPYLKLRLAAGDEPDEPVPWRAIAPGLIGVLYYDLPGSRVLVPASHVQGWFKAGEELFEIALRNVKDGAELKVQQRTVEGLDLTAVFGRDMFSASLALWLGDFLETPAPRGALLVIPFNGGFVFHPITHKGWHRAVEYLLRNADHMIQGPDPLSTDLYWWRDGLLELQPARLDGQAVIFQPSAGLLDAVADL